MAHPGRGTGDADGRAVEVADPADPRLADYRDLRDVELRKHLEAEHGLFLAEGEKVVRRALEAGFAPRSFLMAPRWLDGLADVIASSDAPCYVVREELAEHVTGFHVHRGALASLERRPLPPVTSAGRSPAVLVLEDSSTTPTSVRSSAAARRSASTRSCCRRAARIRSTGARSGRDGRGLLAAVDPAPDWHDALPR